MEVLVPQGPGAPKSCLLPDVPLLGLPVWVCGWAPSCVRAGVHRR